MEAGDCGQLEHRAASRAPARVPRGFLRVLYTVDRERLSHFSRLRELPVNHLRGSADLYRFRGA